MTYRELYKRRIPYSCPFGEYTIYPVSDTEYVVMDSSGTYLQPPQPLEAGEEEVEIGNVPSEPNGDEIEIAAREQLVTIQTLLNCVTDFATEQRTIKIVPKKPIEKNTTLCNCSVVQLMMSGCRCGGY